MLYALSFIIITLHDNDYKKTELPEQNLVAEETSNVVRICTLFRADNR